MPARRLAPLLRVLCDPMSGERSEHELTSHARLSDELMRLFPEGIDGAWRLYDAALNEIRIEEAAGWVLSSDELVILVRTPSGDFGLNLFMAVFLAMVSRALTPSVSRRRDVTSQETRESANNQIAAQTNLLRAAGRVPDILGRVRSWPDLLTYATEEWSDPSKFKTQVIEQFYVIGSGDYEIEQMRLGETPLGLVIGNSVTLYPPGTTVEPVQVVTVSPAVAQISLNATASGAVASSLSFNAAAKTLTSPTERLTLSARDFVTFAGTDSNDAGFYVAVVPPTSQTSGPFVYTLEGPVVDEPNTTPAYRVWPVKFDMVSAYCETRYNGVTSDVRVTGSVMGTQVGDGFNLTIGANTWHGKVKGATYIFSGSTPVFSILTLGDFYGNDIVFPPGSSGYASPFKIYDFLFPNEVTAVRGSTRDGATVLADEAAWSGWFTAPLAAPDEIWIDIAFPGGLTSYISGNRGGISVDVAIEFRRPGAASAQDAETMHFYSDDPSQLRYTKRFAVNPSSTPPPNVTAITLPAGEFVEVRLRRTTPLFVETATAQYVDDMQWHSLRSMVKLPERVYPDFYLIKLRLTNTNSAMSVGESSFNLVATRKLKTWTAGAGWSATPAATRKWADNFVHRCKERDGANRSDAEIDLAGIYALQAQLDALDGGEQGKISLTLDQVQDLDSELAQIADVARARVYRIGRKIYVKRDQEGQAIALFNGRTKAAEGEVVAVRMKSEQDYDAVQLQWMDENSGWKLRELVLNDAYPSPITPVNVLRIAPICCNWAQVYRRARFEWAKVKFRREQLSVDVTEDARICRPGDVVNVTDDLANLAIAAGEVIFISANVLTLDKDVLFESGASYTLTVRDVHGKDVDAIPVVQVAGTPNKVQLTRAPSVAIKGRDEALGTLYAFFKDGSAIVRPWLLTGIQANGSSFLTLESVNYTARVYEGDEVALPSAPPPIGH